MELPAGARGAYRVSATGTYNGYAVGTAETVYAVTERDPELDEVASDPLFLAAVAEAAEGRHYTPDRYDRPLTDEGAGRKVLDRVETPLWRAPGLLALAALMLGLSWVLRRRSGYR